MISQKTIPLMWLAILQNLVSQFLLLSMVEVLYFYHLGILFPVIPWHLTHLCPYNLLL